MTIWIIAIIAAHRSLMSFMLACCCCILNLSGFHGNCCNKFVIVGLSLVFCFPTRQCVVFHESKQDRKCLPLPVPPKPTEIISKSVGQEHITADTADKYYSGANYHSLGGCGTTFTQVVGYLYAL